MKKFIEKLEQKYPLVSFSEVGQKTYGFHEDAFYPFGNPPRGETVKGNFIRIANPMGGVDVEKASDVKLINDLAAWHQTRAEARGFVSRRKTH